MFSQTALRAGVFVFFSRLASRQRTWGQDAISKVQEFDITADENNDIDALIGDSDRNNLLDDIQGRLGLEHPIVYDTHDLCAYHKEGKLQAFNVAMLKTILRHFEVPFRAKDRKTDLIRLLTEVIPECNCWRVDCPFYQTKGTTTFFIVQVLVDFFSKILWQVEFFCICFVTFTRWHETVTLNSIKYLNNLIVFLWIRQSNTVKLTSLTVHHEITKVRYIKIATWIQGSLSNCPDCLVIPRRD